MADNPGAYEGERDEENSGDNEIIDISQVGRLNTQIFGRMSMGLLIKLNNETERNSSEDLENIFRNFMQQIFQTMYPTISVDTSLEISNTTADFTKWHRLFSENWQKISLQRKKNDETELVFSSQTTFDPLGGYIEVKVGLADGTISSYTVHLHFS